MDYNATNSGSATFTGGREMTGLNGINRWL